MNRPPALAPRRVPVELQRDPYIDVVKHKSKSRRHHAYDLCRRIVQLDKAADDTSITAEPRLPQMMADNGHSRRIRAVVILVDASSEHRRDTKQWKEFGRDRLHAQSGRFTGASQDRSTSGRPCRDAFERVVVALPIEPGRRRDRVMTVAAPALRTPSPGFRPRGTAAAAAAPDRRWRRSPCWRRCRARA